LSNVVLALQGGIADGSEPTFDGQPMQKGVHLRWSFLAALGFPPGGFWLCRREAKGGERQIPLPPRVEQLVAARGMATQSATSRRTGTPDSNQSDSNVQSTDATGNEWKAFLKSPCRSISLAGCATPGCDEVLIETFGCNRDGKLEVTGRRVVKVEEGAFRVTVQAGAISGVRVVGAGKVEECGCGSVEPPTDCGCGGKGDGGGQGPPGGGDPGWGDPNDNGWQCWGVPFTLPVTVKEWPARYYGAPDPTTTAGPLIVEADIKEARRRLGTLKLGAKLTAAKENAALAELWVELWRLVHGFPATLLNDVMLQAPAAGASAPKLSLTLMQQLLLMALDPYFARVLGLYFVDEDAKPGVKYDYSVTGYWGLTNCDNAVIFPGLTPGATLARGNATFGGITIKSRGGATSLWRWTKYDASGGYTPRVDTSAPTLVQDVAKSIQAALAQADQPDAMLLAFSPGLWYMPATERPQLRIELSQRAARVDVRVIGAGTVQAFSGGTSVASASFSSASFVTLTVNAPGPDELIDAIEVIGPLSAPMIGRVVLIGAMTLHPLSPDAIGTQFAMIGPPVAIKPVAAPGEPYTTFRHRQADIDPGSLTLVRHTLMDVEWPAAPVPATEPGDPMTDPLNLPPPTAPVGFVTERQDSSVAKSVSALDGWIATRRAPKPKDSKIATAELYRRVDSGLADPVGGWQHRVAGFDIFGALGKWSGWSDARGVEKIAGAPTSMRIVQFDNTAAAGGAAAADGSNWSGGTLRLIVNWDGASYMMYPDIATARIKVHSIDQAGTETGELAEKDVVIPPATIAAYTVLSVTPKPTTDGNGYTVEIQTTPPLKALATSDPAQMLMLTLPDGSSERYSVRPSVPAGSAWNVTSPIVATVTAGKAARIIVSSGDYVGQPAYLVSGFGVQTAMAVPLVIPVGTDTARAQVTVRGSTQNPFLYREMIVDPNGVNAPRREPVSAKLIFMGPQRLTPPVPPTPVRVIPVHKVNHLYYDPAGVDGVARRTLPFTTPAASSDVSYILQREPVRSLSLADVKRRIAAGSLADNNPVVVDGGSPRVDLAAWIAQLGAWLTAYNAVASYRATHASPPVSYTPVTAANALQNTDAQRAFIEHFYGGLLDEELCSLANVAGNSQGYVRVNTQKIVSAPVADAVDGTGYGRTVYRLAALNHAGNASSFTGSIGPYYTVNVTAPRPPVMYKLQPTETAIIVAWALDANPDVAAYMLYRAGDIGQLQDLRFFGADAANPSPASKLPTVEYNTQSYPALTFVQGAEVDSRIVGFIPDPRLCARDYAGSDMAEVVLPPGAAPDDVKGVYRLSEYIDDLGPEGQVGLNYWTPPAVGGIAQVQMTSPTQARLTGLRVGLGRGVPVVVVATWGREVKAIGRLPLRRAGFVDGATAGGTPMDANAIAGSAAPSTTALNAYAAVAVDIFGNRSKPSSIFAAQMLAAVTV
jgi:hypothetical protein